LKGRVEPDDNGLIVGGADQMAISVNEIAQQSGAALDQIRSYPINWSLASIATGRGAASFVRKRTAKPITTSPKAKAGNIAIGISNVLVRSPFRETLSVVSETGYAGSSDAVAAIASPALTERVIGGGSGHTTAVGTVG
jgi:hypothetical protein